MAYQVTWADLEARRNRGRIVVGPAEPGRPPRDLRPDPRRDHSPEWSPDGTRLSFLGRQGPRDQVFVAPADDGEALQLTDFTDGVFGASWSPDGRALAVLAWVVGDPDAVVDDPRPPDGEEQARRPPVARVVRTLNYKRDGTGYLDGRHTHVFVVPADGGEPRQLTTGAWSVEGVAWAPDGRSLAIVGDAEPEADLRRSRRLYALDVEGGARRSLARDLLISSPAWSPRGDLVAFIAPLDDEGGRLERVWVVPAAGGEPRCLTAAFDRSVAGSVMTDMRGAHAARLRWSEAGDRLYFLASDHGVEGWLLAPPGFDPARRHPLVMQVHGGPHGLYGWSFFHEFQVLAGMGFLVFYVNPRGSDGYGEDFRMACVRDWGGRDYEDLMAALDQLIERTGFVDEARLGIGGGSYGGFMTNWAIGHTDRFAAAVSMRSISNLVSEFAQHDIVLWGEVEMGPRPWPDSDELWRRSPIRYVREMRTPLLLLHGEMDLRCAISQAEELFGAMRLVDKEVELVRFPGESHDLSRSGRPDRRVERLHRIAGWLGRYLLDRTEAREEAAAPASS